MFERPQTTTAPSSAAGRWSARSPTGPRAGPSRPRRRLAGLRPVYDEAGLIPPKDHTPVMRGLDASTTTTTGDAGRLRDELHVLAGAAAPHRASPGCAPSWPPGTRVNLEVTVNHRYEHVAADARGCPSTTPSERRPDDDDEEDRPPRPRRPPRAAKAAARRAHLRRHRHRRRPQRPRQRRLPRQGRPADADPRAPAPRRRRRHHRGAAPRLLVHDVLVRALAAAPRDHPGAGARQARLHAAAHVVHVRAHGERRLPAG